MLGPVLSAGGTTVTPVARAWSGVARLRRGGARAGETDTLFGAVFAIWARPYELAVTTAEGSEQRVRIRDIELCVFVATCALVLLAAAVRIGRSGNA